MSIMSQNRRRECIGLGQRGILIPPMISYQSEMVILFMM